MRISRNYPNEGNNDAFTSKASYDRSTEINGEKMAYETREVSRGKTMKYFSHIQSEQQNHSKYFKSDRI